MLPELELDQQFWNAISSRTDFCAWVLSKTKFSSTNAQLITDEKWHQRWFRDPTTKKDSETDILLMFLDPSSQSRYALHIENKPDRGRWEPLQAENYRKRALDRMAKWRYVDFQTALLTPQSVILRSATEVAHFDVILLYEEVARFVPDFGI